MSPERKLLAAFGLARHVGYVRVFRERVHERPLVRVQWREGGRLVTQSFPDSRKGIAEARAYAEATSERLTAAPMDAPTDGLTVRQLFDRYITAKVDAWRPRTLQNKRDRWKKFEHFVKRDAVAALVTRETLDSFKRVLLARGHSPHQVQAHLDAVTAVWRWAVDRDLIPPTKVTAYRPEFGRDVLATAPKMAEYSRQERAQLIAALDPRDSRQWRAWALTTLFAYTAVRQTAGRSLTWADVDFEAGELHWRGETDKMGTDRRQPMPAPVREALWVAYGWRTRDGYTGPFVFYAAAKAARAREAPYTYQAFNHALHAAEKRAGVATVKYRAAHGHRRGVAGDLYDATGSEHAAAEWLGDKSVKIVRDSYLLERKDRLRKLADTIEGPTAGPDEDPKGGADG